MIFDTIRYGTFTADDFINVRKTNDYIKFTSLPIDLRKKFISDVVDLYPNKESNNFKQAAFDFLDGKITEDQFCDIYWKYWMPSAIAAAGAAAAAAVVAVAMAAAMAAEYYRPYLEQHAKLLNKLIKEYESC